MTRDYLGESNYIINPISWKWKWDSMSSSPQFAHGGMFTTLQIVVVHHLMFAAELVFLTGWRAWEIANIWLAYEINHEVCLPIIRILLCNTFWMFSLHVAHEPGGSFADFGFIQQKIKTSVRYKSQMKHFYNGGEMLHFPQCSARWRQSPKLKVLNVLKVPRKKSSERVLTLPCFRKAQFSRFYYFPII